MRCLLVALVVWAATVAHAHAQMRGHGGPVRALAISADGKTALSGSFDTAAIRWNLTSNSAEQVMRFHEAAVNAVAILPDGRLVTGGEDGKIAIWSAGNAQPDKVLEGHTAPILALAISPDGKTIATGSFDHSLRLWPLDGGMPQVREGHNQAVNGVAFTPDGKFIVTAGYDLTVKIWERTGDAVPASVTLPTPLNGIAVAPDGEIVTAGADGRVFFVSPKAELRGELQAAPTPVISLALSSDGERVAAAGIRGSVAIIARKARNLERTLVGPGLPVWSVAFVPGQQILLTGGADRLVRRWNAATGDHIGAVAIGPEDPLAAFAGNRGAEIYRACVACHTLTPDEGNRAGPTLAGIFGRRIATLPGYNFSPALKKLDILWTPETVAKLFEIGPAAYTPGTKMPEQTIGAAEDRKALTDFLAQATAKR